MSDETSTSPVAPAITAYTVDKDVVAAAVENGVLALDPEEIGDRGLMITRPISWVTEVVDVTKYEDLPRRRDGLFTFTRWQSLVTYVNTYIDEASTFYVKDINGMGAAALVGDHDLGTVVLDEHPATGTANRNHKGILRVRPTPAAMRWGKALAASAIDQETLLDLVVDGITEIASPPGADLRDLVSDLHAVRSTEAHSVIRAGGGTTVEMAENVALHGGTGNKLTIPEVITIVFAPWTAIDDRIVLEVKLKAKVVKSNDGKTRIAFALSAPTLDVKLAEVVDQIAELVNEATALSPLWVP